VRSRSYRKPHAACQTISDNGDLRALAGLGNFYRHDYDMIDAHLMWESIERRLEPLRKVAEQELRQLLGQ
jgi:hypothetical protein